MKSLLVKLVKFLILTYTNPMQARVIFPIQKVEFTLHFDKFIKFHMSISLVRDIKLAVKFVKIGGMENNK